MTISIVPESPPCGALDPPSRLLQDSDDQIVSDDSPRHCHASVVPHLDRHSCLGAAEGAGLCAGLWLKGHLRVLTRIIHKKHRIRAIHTETLSFWYNRY